MLQFLFGEGTDTPDAQSLARKRAIIDQLTARELNPQTFGAGLRQFGGAVAGRVGDRRLDPKEDAERERVIAEFNANPIIAAMLGGMPSAPMSAPVMPPAPPQGQPTQPPVTGAPVPPVATSPLPPADFPASVAETVSNLPGTTGAVGNPMLPAVEQGIPLANYDAPNLLPPIPGGGMAQGGSQGQLTEAAISGMGAPDMETAIRQGLVGRGMPAHVADAFIMNFRDESGLRTDINEAAPIVPGSRGGFGLAQWTGPRRRELEAFAQARGTPVSDLDTQLDFLMNELQGSESRAAQAILGAQDTPTAADAILRQFLRPAAEHQNRRSAAYLGGQEVGSGTPMGMTETMSSMGGSMPSTPNMGIVMQLAELMSNPYLPEGQRMVAQALIQQQIGSMDPMRQMQLQRAQMEMDQLQSPGMGAVRSSQILTDGTTVQSTDNGVRVFHPSRGELTGQDAADAIAEANRLRVEQETAINQGRRTGTYQADLDLGGAAANAIKGGELAANQGSAAYESLLTVRSNIGNIDRAIAALDAGARSGAIEAMLPNITVASAELQNAMDMMGLDIIGMVTFGALSQAELQLAMETAVPRNLDEPQLREWLVNKKAAQEATAAALENAALFLMTPGNTIPMWIEQNRPNGAPPGAGNFANMSREEMQAVDVQSLTPEEFEAWAARARELEGQ